MKALLEIILILAFAFGLVAVPLAAVIWLELPKELSFIAVALVFLVLALTFKKDETRYPYRPSPLPSFESGLPVIIRFPSHTITVDTLGVHVRRQSLARCILQNLAWLRIRDFDASLSEFREVSVCGSYVLFTCEGVISPQLTVEVMLIHQHSAEKSVLLAQGEWDLDLHAFSIELVDALIRLCEDAGRALSLPIRKTGVLNLTDLRKAEANA